MVIRDNVERFRLMNLQPLKSFVDEELARLPLFVDEALQATLESLARSQREGPMAERSTAADVAKALFEYRARALRAYVDCLTELVLQEWRQEWAEGSIGESIAPLGANQSSARGPFAPPPLSRRIGLELVGEAAVTGDVAQANALEALRALAEHEIRELATYSAALVGDMDVARDWNPLRPEAHAKALWAAAQALPQRESLPMHFMRLAANPFGHCLRKAYANACQRLEDRGVQPAIYRTLILPRGARSSRPDSTLEPEQLQTLTFAFSGAASAAAESHPGKRTAGSLGLQVFLPGSAPQTSSGDGSASAKAIKALDAEALDLLGRIFDTLLGDRRLSAKSSLAKLQTLALRVAAREPQLLEQHDHALWQLMDDIAFYADVLMDAPAERHRFISASDQLLDHLAAETEQKAALYDWARQRVAAMQRHGFEQRLRAQSLRLPTLQAQDGRLAAGETPTEPAALGSDQLETLPSALLSVGGDSAFGAPPQTEAEASAWLARREPGEWWRCFVDGAWQQMQLLWVGTERQAWLMAWASDSPDETSALAFESGALLRLREAGVAHVRQRRCLVRDAREYLLRKAQAKQRA